MVIFTVLHMLRTFFTGSYKKDRSFTWFTGVFLLLITLVLSFSGYLLPWDQLSYWAVTIGTSMAEAAPIFGNQVNLLLRGAPDIGANGLLRFYLAHVVLFPLAAILLISVHYYKVAREHGISLPARFEEGDAPAEKKKEARTRVDFIPDLLTGEVFWTILGLFVLIVGVSWLGYHAPLESHANPQVTPLDTEAPWYFWWLQGMLKLGDKSLMGIVLPTILLLLLIGLPYIDRNPYRSMYKRPIAVALGLLGVAAILALSYMGTPDYGIEKPPAQAIIQKLAPQEGEGPVQMIPFDQLLPGSYEVNVSPTRDLCTNLDYGCPALEKVFSDFTGMVNGEIKSGKLADAKGAMVIEDWQKDLKKVTMRITWTENNKPQSYDHALFLHRDRGEE